MEEVHGKNGISDVISIAAKDEMEHMMTQAED